MAVKNLEVLKQIEVMLSDLKDKDKRTYDIVLDLLKLVFVEYNTGKNQQIEKKLYDMIDAEINYKLKK
ncbi:MAG: hypothetical protein BroJett005_11530 [Ignavibacteriota bacterium]|nr:MAG: hypothetical protein BroJett005_11530 [Ignavibacteriota bacterium]